jgi:histidinol-phosphate phosphatase family protein
MELTMRPALFLDKDGTLVKDVPYNSDPDLIEFSENALEGLKELHSAGFALFVVSNQPGVALGYFKERELSTIRNALREMMRREGLPLEECYFCPHREDATLPHYRVPCECRKPSPGMLLAAAREHPIALEKSWMIGDILDDVEAGNRAGCRSILLDNGNETEWRLDARERHPTFIARSINDACRIILSSHTSGEER